jgi:hypothetical protein
VIHVKSAHLPTLLAAAVVLGLAACESTTSAIPTLLTDATINADVATNSGDAVAAAVENMNANETFNALPYVGSNSTDAAPVLEGVRSRTCYDANGAVISNCLPLSSVRKIVTHVEINGSRTGTSNTEGGTAKTWSGVAHRVSNDTLVRTFNTSQPPAEISRTHSDVTVGHDTTTFTEGNFSRSVSEATRDSIKAVKFNLPRSSNPWPVSGSIVRVDTVKATATLENKTESRNVVRIVQVDFPADAQGNVVLKVNDKTCNLNLTTHAVTNCH